MGLCALWGDYKNKTKYTNMKIKERNLIYNTKNYKQWTQWSFVPLGPTLTYTCENLNNLRKYLEANQCVDGNMCNNKNQHPFHNLPQTCGGRKLVCPVCIWPTENLKSHPRKSFRNNERWFNKYDTHKSTINKIRLGQRTWRIFYIKHTKNTNNNTWLINNWIDKNNLYWLNCSFIYQEQ